MPTIEYVAPRVLSKFLNSDAFVRCVVGPVGSGKSSACVVEVLLRASKQTPGLDKVRRTRFAIIRNCYDDKTEILTEHRGWVRFADLGPTERVAALHGNEVRWEVPTYHYAAPYKGEMVGIRSQSIDMLVTPEHRLWVSRRATRAKRWGDYAHVRADAVEGLGETLRFKTTATFPPTAASGDASFYEFLGFWFAEGYAGEYPREGGGTHWRLVVTQRPRPYVDSMLRAAGFEYTKQPKPGGCANYVISTKSERVKSLIRELRGYGTNARDKRLPRHVIEAPPHLAAAFLRGFHEGDGSGGAKNRQRPEIYHSKSKALLDGIQEMLFRAGRSASMNYDRSADMWAVTAHSAERSSPVIQKRHWRREMYDGMVYCVEVSSHVVLVRRNGRVAWCGQTYRELKDTTRKTFEQWIPTRLGKWHEQDFTFTMDRPLADGTRMHCEVLFRALDRPEHVKKLLSLELTGAYINEARQVPKAILDVLSSRVGRYPSKAQGGATWFGIWMDTNAWATQHWGYRLFSKALPEGFELFEQPGGRAPNAENLENLPKGYYERLCQGKDSAWIAEYVDSQYPSHDKGSIYGSLIAAIEARNGVVAFEHPTDLVFTVWDLGRADSTAIWFYTLRPGGVDVLDHYENHGQRPSHYFGLLDQWSRSPADGGKGYRYVVHWLPHDAKAKTFATERSMLEQMLDRFGPGAVRLVPNLSVADGIAAARTLLEGDIRFHARCDVTPIPGINSGLESLRAYRYAWNETLQTFSKEPLHDASSHSADSFRYLALAVTVSGAFVPRPRFEEPPRPPLTLEEHVAFVKPPNRGPGRIG